MKLLSGLLMTAATGALALYGQPRMVRAGDTTHEITGIAIVETIPKSWTQPRFAAIAAVKTAPAGQVYMVIRGRVTNGSSESRILNALSLWLEDSAGTKYKNDGAGTVIFHPEGTGISPMRLAGGETKVWIGFFPVPKGATGLKLVATDLRSRTPASMALPDALPGHAGPLGWPGPVAVGTAPLPEVGFTAANIVGVWVLDETASKAAADGSVAGVKRVAVRPDGTFTLMQGLAGKWRISGGRFLVTYDQSAATRIDEAVTMEGNHLLWPSPANSKRFAYLLKQ